jgi:hypothetical protein
MAGPGKGRICSYRLRIWDVGLRMLDRGLLISVWGMLVSDCEFAISLSIVLEFQ